MSVELANLEVSSKGRGFVEITGEVNRIVARGQIENGLCHLFLKHTSASLLITENADSDVRADLETFMQKYAPDGDPAYRHDMEGADDMPAHIRSVLTATELTVPIRSHRLALGAWQGIYLWEHRYRPHTRRLELTLCG
jgi:secondary thiamine-phosphate synthase enzyme